MKFLAKVGVLTAFSLIVVMALGSAVYGANDNKSVTVSATVGNFIAMDPITNVTLSPQIDATGSAEGSTVIHVATNNDNGYKLEATASGPSGQHTLRKGTDSFADYSGAGNWSITASDSAFGFSVNNTTSYQGFTVGSAVPLYTNNNETAGEDTTLNFKAEVGTNHLQPSGSYSANLTVTATTL